MYFTLQSIRMQDIFTTLAPPAMMQPKTESGPEIPIYDEIARPAPRLNRNTVTFKIHDATVCI
jgi:hypothetical protein